MLRMLDQDYDLYYIGDHMTELWHKGATILQVVPERLFRIRKKEAADHLPQVTH
ncbi:MAG: hypothetical protein Q8Q08_00820 [Candidatus Omnitrophota bacterium]|nr:hypothetical protein [Candidatus Omnitrophota bacterium]MDZ4242294.1 hypothetical protein [Candidatus Omnitrophota bacterium]